MTTVRSILFPGVYLIVNNLKSAKVLRAEGISTRGVSGKKKTKICGPCSLTADGDKG